MNFFLRLYKGKTKKWFPQQILIVFYVFKVRFLYPKGFALKTTTIQTSIFVYRFKF